MRFQDIPGLHTTKKQLSQAVLTQHIAHAQLFHGPSGGAQLAMALAFTSFFIWAFGVESTLILDDSEIEMTSFGGASVRGGDAT